VIDLFLQSLQQKGRKAETVKQYEYALNQFELFLSQQNYSLFTATTSVISNYYRSIIDQSLSSSTNYKRSQAVFSFYNWLENRGTLLLNPAPPPIKRTSDALPRSVPKTKSIKQAYGILSELKRPVEQRDCVMFELMYSCGIRREEVQRLNIDDIDFYTQTIRIFGKGDRDRVVPIGEKTLNNLRYYTLYIRPKLIPTGRTNALFVSWKKGGKRMHKGSISQAFIRLRKRLGIAKNITPHALRHAFATDLLQSGASMVDVSKMLGHQRVETTQIYTRLTPTDLKKQHNRFHPRE